MALLKPVAKNPPSFQRLVTDGPVSGPNPEIGSSTPMPTTIMPTMAVTLIAENQNSAFPNSPTEMRFAQNRTRSATSAVSQTGTDGHQ